MQEDKIVQKVVKHLENSIASDLRSSVRTMLQEVVREEFEGLHKRFNTLERTMDMWKSDLDQDREDLSNIRRNTGAQAIEVKEMSKNVDNLPKKVENAVKDTVRDTLPTAVAEEVPKAVNGTFDIFSKKVRVLEKPQSWLKRLFRIK